MTDEPIQRRDPPSDPSDLCKLQLDYAWKWFSYHADQRVKMFNFMLIVFGVFATAVATAMDKGLPSGFTATLCFIAAALGLIFSRLDRRNRDLVWLGEEVLTDAFGEELHFWGRYKNQRSQGQTHLAWNFVTSSN